jgi:hypothetical protein
MDVVNNPHLFAANSGSCAAVECNLTSLVTVPQKKLVSSNPGAALDRNSSLNYFPIAPNTFCNILLLWPIGSARMACSSLAIILYKPSSASAVT